MKDRGFEYNFYWPSWWHLWPFVQYVPYNEDGHYGPLNFGKTYFCIGPFQSRWWTHKKEAK